MAGNNNKKRWLIGCGGCLVAVVVLLVVLALALVLLGRKVEESTRTAEQHLLGSPVPENYQGIGIPYSSPSGEGHQLVAFTHKGSVLLAYDTQMQPADFQGLRQDEAAFRQTVQSLLNRAPTMVQMFGAQQFSPESMVMVQTAGTPVKSYRLLQGKTASDGSSYPAVVAVLPNSETRAVVLVQMDTTSGSPDPGEDVSMNYALLIQNLEGFVNQTALDDRLKSTGSKEQSNERQ